MSECKNHVQPTHSSRREDSLQFLFRQQVSQEVWALLVPGDSQIHLKGEITGVTRFGGDNGRYFWTHISQCSLQSWCQKQDGGVHPQIRRCSVIQDGETLCSYLPSAVKIISSGEKFLTSG